MAVFRNSAVTCTIGQGSDYAPPIPRAPHLFHHMPLLAKV
jgi:hypothetical protein